MLKILPENKSAVLWAILIVAGFVAIRAFESQLFYDPFVAYFKGDFTAVPYPSVDETRLLLNYFARFGLNAMLSIALLHVLFRNREVTVFAGVLYAMFFVVFLVAFILVWKEAFGQHKMALFYVRRFLIQPLLILLFLPAFYVQLRSEKNNNP
jgi:exosortase F-associated protein